MTEPRLNEEAVLLPVRKTPMYIPASPMVARLGRAGPRAVHRRDPPFGAAFTYWLRDEYQSLREKRHEREGAEEGGTGPFYPSWDSLRAEAREEEPAVVLTVTDASGNVAPPERPFGRGLPPRRVGPALGVVRAGGAWRSHAGTGTRSPNGPLATPGTYTGAAREAASTACSRRSARRSSSMCEPIGTPSVPAADRSALLAFEQKTARLQQRRARRRPRAR